MSKRILSMLLSLCLLAGSAPACAMEQVPETAAADTTQAAANADEITAEEEIALPEEQSEPESEELPQEAETVKEEQPVQAQETEIPVRIASGTGAAQSTQSTQQIDTDSVESDTGELREVHFDEDSSSNVAAWGRDAVFRKRVLSAWDEYKTIVDVSGLNLTTKNIDEIFQNEYVPLLDANAKYFYVKASIDYTYNLSTGELLTLTVQYKPEYCKDDAPDEVKIVSMQKQLETAVSRALECVSEDMSDIEVALALHDYLVRELDYDYQSELAVSNGELEDFPEADCTAAGALLNRTAVCQGYAQAYSNLLQRWGIESYIVTSRPMNHSWNLVCMDGKWYHVDVTWDDPVWENYATGGYTQYYDGNNDALDEGYVQHTYFLKGDSEIEELSHYGWTGKLPKAEQNTDFSGYCFYERNCALYWRDGYWYFSPEGREIYRAKINERGSVYLKLNHRTRYTHGYSSNLYSTDGANIYRTAIADGAEEIVLAAPENHIITEFAIKQKRLVYVLWDTEADQYSRHTSDLTPTEAQSRITGVKLDRTELTLPYGKTAELTATVLPEGVSSGVLRWRSSNRDIVTVKDGVVTAVDSGKAVVTVTAGGKTAECTVTVQEPAVERITLSETGFSLVEGGGKQLTARAVAGSRTRSDVTWTSSDPTVASVSQSGWITAQRAGQAVITASVDGKSAACTVKVLLPAPEVKTAVQKNGSVQITWSAVDGAASYRVYRKTSSGWKKLTELKSTAKRIYTDSGREGTTSVYTVRAVHKISGAGDYNSDGVRAVVPPAKTELKAASAGYDSVKLSWSSAAGAGSYRIYRRQDGGWKRIDTVSADSKAYTISGLTCGAEYTFTVRAFKGSTGGDYMSVTAKPVPAAPVLRSVTAGTKQATVKWSKVSGAQGYRLYRKTGGGSWQTVKTVGADTAQYTDRNLKSGTKYTYTVRAYRKTGSNTVLGGYDKTGKTVTVK